ncbi:MAG: DNA polymerase III subunit delta [Mycoplasmataceae bacterium]|nr:DNA polymerase III subunit delta [Mycoplasmataceae bacterium]
MKFIYGQEQYLINKKLREYLKASEVEPTSFGFDSSFDDIEMEITTVGLFSEEKLIVIKNHTMFSNKDEAAKMVKIIESIGDETEIIFIQETSKALDRVNPLIKVLLKNAQCTKIDLLKESQIVEVIKDIVKSKKGTISNGGVIKLSIKLPNNLYIIIREVEKLLMENKDITNEMVEESIGDYIKEDAFALSNAIISGDSHSIVSAYNEKIANGEVPSRLISNISTVLTMAKLVSSYQEQGNTNDAIALKLHIHPFRVKKSAELISKTTPKRLDELVSGLADLDKNIKIGKVDASLGLDKFILDLIRGN